MITTNETIIKIPNSNRFIALEPTLEELTQTPQKFSMSLIDPAESEPIGTYQFRQPITTPKWTKYKSSKITSYKPNSNVPRQLISASTKILQEIAKKQKQTNPSYKLEHLCNFYLMRSNAVAENSSIKMEKANTITDIYKKNKYDFKNTSEATRTY